MFSLFCSEHLFFGNFRLGVLALLFQLKMEGVVVLSFRSFLPLNCFLISSGRKCSLLAEVSHDEAKMRERRETSAGFRSVFYHACVCVSLTTSDVFVACDTTHRTGLHAKLQEMSRTPRSRKFEESEDVR